jgi:hypothetical protein
MFDYDFTLQRSAALRASKVADAQLKSWTNQGLFKDIDRNSGRGYDFRDVFELRIADALSALGLPASFVIAAAHSRKAYVALLDNQAELRLVREGERLVSVPPAHLLLKPYVAVPLLRTFAETLIDFEGELLAQARTFERRTEIGVARLEYRASFCLKRPLAYQELLKVENDRSLGEE